MNRPVIEVIGATPAPQTAAPAVVLRLRIAVDGGRVHAMVLRVQIHLDARRRSYNEDERKRLFELFGDEQFARTLRPIVWTQTSLTVPAFEGAAECDLPVACTNDLDVASAKYLNAVRDGDIPLQLLFSGSMFGFDDGVMSVEPVPWDLQAPARLPAGTWREVMDRFFPGGGWVRLQQDTIDRLQEFRGRWAMTSWDAAIDALLDRARSEAAS